MSDIKHHPFTHGYIDAIEFTESEEWGADTDGFSDAALRQIYADCEAFLAKHSEDLEGREYDAGVCFWLSRNHHGSGFWDSDFAAKDALDETSKKFRECNTYVGDSNEIHLD